MKKLTLLITFIFCSLFFFGQSYEPGLKKFSQRYNTDTAVFIMQNVNGGSFSGMASVTGSDTAWYLWDGSILNFVANDVRINGQPISSANMGLQAVTDVDSVTTRSITVDGVKSSGDINITDITKAYLYDDAQALKLAKGTDGYYANTFVGLEAGNDTISRQTAVGYQAGKDNVGISQTAVGYLAGKNNTGYSQTAIGFGAGGTNSGDATTFVGLNAGSNNSGALSTAVGYYAGAFNTKPQQTAIGNYSGQSNSGLYQTTIGYYSGASNSGNEQIAVGYFAGYNNSGADVSIMGIQAGRDNTGNYIVALGYEAARNNTADNVVSLGYGAGKNNTTANQFIVKQTNVNTTPLMQGNFSTGRLGINMTTPAYNLDVNGTANISTSLQLNGSDVETSIASKLSISDTNAMLNPYLKISDYTGSSLYLDTVTKTLRYPKSIALSSAYEIDSSFFVKDLYVNNLVNSPGPVLSPTYYAVWDATSKKIYGAQLKDPYLQFYGISPDSSSAANGDKLRKLENRTDIDVIKVDGTFGIDSATLTKRYVFSKGSQLLSSNIISHNAQIDAAPSDREAIKSLITSGTYEFVNYTDTTNLRSDINGNTTSIGILSTNLNSKVNYADTNSMLDVYIERKDTAAMLTPYLNKAVDSYVVDNTGNWTGTFDGQEGTYYLDANPVLANIDAADTTRWGASATGISMADTLTLIGTKYDVDTSYNRIAKNLTAADTIRWGTSSGAVTAIADSMFLDYYATTETPNGTDDWNTAISTAFTNQDVIIIRGQKSYNPSVYYFSNGQIPVGKTLYVWQGARIKGTITFDTLCNFGAGRYQCFDTNIVIHGERKLNYTNAYPEWFGAITTAYGEDKENHAYDDTKAWELLLKYFYKDIRFPNYSEYTITRTLRPKPNTVISGGFSSIFHASDTLDETVMWVDSLPFEMTRVGFTVDNYQYRDSMYKAYLFTVEIDNNPTWISFPPTSPEEGDSSYHGSGIFRNTGALVLDNIMLIGGNRFTNGSNPKFAPNGIKLGTKPYIPDSIRLNPDYVHNIASGALYGSYDTSFSYTVNQITVGPMGDETAGYASVRKCIQNDPQGVDNWDNPAYWTSLNVYAHSNAVYFQELGSIYGLRLDTCVKMYGDPLDWGHWNGNTIQKVVSDGCQIGVFNEFSARNNTINHLHFQYTYSASAPDSVKNWLYRQKALVTAAHVNVLKFSEEDKPAGADTVVWLKTQPSTEKFAPEYVLAYGRPAPTHTPSNCLLHGIGWGEVHGDFEHRVYSFDNAIGTLPSVGDTVIDTTDNNRIGIVMEISGSSTGTINVSLPDLITRKIKWGNNHGIKQINSAKGDWRAAIASNGDYEYQNVNEYSTYSNRIGKGDIGIWEKDPKQSGSYYNAYKISRLNISDTLSVGDNENLSTDQIFGVFGRSLFKSSGYPTIEAGRYLNASSYTQASFRATGWRSSDSWLAEYYGTAAGSSITFGLTDLSDVYHNFVTVQGFKAGGSTSSSYNSRGGGKITVNNGDDTHSTVMHFDYSGNNYLSDGDWILADTKITGTGTVTTTNDDNIVVGSAGVFDGMAIGDIVWLNASDPSDRVVTAISNGNAADNDTLTVSLKYHSKSGGSGLSWGYYPKHLQAKNGDVTVRNQLNASTLSTTNLADDGTDVTIHGIKQAKTTPSDGDIPVYRTASGGMVYETKPSSTSTPGLTVGQMLYWDGTGYDTVPSSNLIYDPDTKSLNVYRIEHEDNPSTSDYSGITTQVTAGETVAFGDLVYMSGNNTVSKAKLTTTGSPTAKTADVVGIVVSGTTGTITILLKGYVSKDGWSFTAGDALYANDASVTATVPSSASYTYGKKVGVATDANTILFSNEYSLIGF